MADFGEKLIAYLRCWWVETAADIDDGLIACYHVHSDEVSVLSDEVPAQIDCTEKDNYSVKSMLNCHDCYRLRNNRNWCAA